jgi:hypothetical protein
MSVKLLGFAASVEVSDAPAFAQTIRSELEAARILLGSNMVALSGANTLTELTFLRTCIELRVPTIVFLPNEEPFPDEPESETSKLRKNLLSVTLATYLTPQPFLPILDWADALISANSDDEDEFLADAVALGIPIRKLHACSFNADWTHLPHPASPAKHGFPTRRELLEFLDKRFLF